MANIRAGESRFCSHCGRSQTGESGGRESIWSVSAAWKTAFFSIFSVSTLIATIVIIAYQIANRGNAAIMETHRSTAEWVFINGAAQALAIYSATEAWETTMVLANHLRQRLLEPLKERQRMEGRAEGVAEGRAEGRVEGIEEGRMEGRVEGRMEGRAESDAMWRAWNERRERAAASGEPFHEPPPSVEG